MSRFDNLLDEAFGKKKPKIVENAIERLNPPPTNYHAVDAAVHALSPILTTPGGIDFSYLANNSSFQRGIMEFIKKFVPGMEAINPRGSKEVMNKSFNKNAANYKLVMSELKEKLAERRKKADENIY